MVLIDREAFYAQIPPRSKAMTTAQLEILMKGGLPPLSMYEEFTFDGTTYLRNVKTKGVVIPVEKIFDVLLLFWTLGWEEKRRQQRERAYEPPGQKAMVKWVKQARLDIPERVTRLWCGIALEGLYTVRGTRTLKPQPPRLTTPRLSTPLPTTPVPTTPTLTHYDPYTTPYSPQPPCSPYLSPPSSIPSSPPKTIEDLSHLPLLPAQQAISLLQQTYEQTVPHFFTQITKAKVGTSEHYGEIAPYFVNDIITRLAISPSDTFIDLGSGVGNVCLQVSLQTGATSYGIELMPDRTTVATQFQTALERTLHAKGYGMGPCTLRTGDFLTDTSTADILMTDASIVFINNPVFTASTLQGLKALFASTLKEGTRIVSMVNLGRPQGRKLTLRNATEFESMVTTRVVPYESGWVSWAATGKEYFVHTVDRSETRNFFLRLQCAAGPG
ncbi:Nucleosomal histone H3-Lys79 methylase [Rhizophlyctis rosea]|nr:Nucleosomal histone H3-Lys79 methylase [Rhizophlyctis rosea]